MVGRIGRLLAPIAIIAVLVIVYLIVHATVGNNTDTPTHQSHSALASKRHHHKHKRNQPTFYVVKAGDTLSAIAASNHVSIARLTKLNPGTSANALQTGTRLRLRR